MGNFGDPTDHFGLATADLILIDSDDAPVADSRVDAIDGIGDIADKAYTGAGAIRDVKCIYSLIGNSLDLSTLFLGELSAGKIVSGITATPAAGACPRIEVTGQLGNEAVVAPSGFLNKWKLPAITLTPLMAAVPMGFTVTTGKLQTVSLTASCNIAQDTGADGDPVAHGVSGASAQVQCTLTATSAAVPAIAAAAGWTIMQPISTTEPQANWRTGSATLDIVLSREAAPPA
jgi:hypothetical protein